MDQFVPYCGIAPHPGSLSWNLDPVFLVLLAAVALAYAWRAGWRSAARSPLYPGLLVFALAIVSPLCNLSVALFSARSGQHVLISLMAAPLIAAALPSRAVSARAGLWASLAFAVVFWAWHLPVAYNATLQNNAVYWAMHLTIIGAAIWLWAAIWHGSSLVASMALFFTSMQMALLGALLTFSPRALYAVHLGVTQAWGWSPLEDQRLGGLIMWIVAGVLMTAYGLMFLGRLLSSGRGAIEGSVATDHPA